MLPSNLQVQPLVLNLPTAHGVEWQGCGSTGENTDFLGDWENTTGDIPKTLVVFKSENMDISDISYKISIHAITLFFKYVQ